MVSWDIVCKPIKAQGLGILDIHNMSNTLLTKWVARLLSSREHLVTKILKESYAKELNWEEYTTLVYRASSFCHGLGHIFRQTQAFFLLSYETGHLFSTRLIIGRPKGF